METRNCQECSEKLAGRKDQKFCSDYCRNTFNNRLNEDATKYIRRINNILRKSSCTSQQNKRTNEIFHILLILNFIIATYNSKIAESSPFIVPVYFTSTEILDPTGRFFNA